MQTFFARVVVVALIGGCTASSHEETDDPSQSAVEQDLPFGDGAGEPIEGVLDPFAGALALRRIYVVDQSTSLQFTDAQNERFVALGAILDEILGDPEGEVAFVGFATWARSQSFTHDRSELGSFIDPAAMLGVASDAQGALATTADLVAADLAALEPQQRPHVRYEVTLIVDGPPGPVCHLGCGDDEGPYLGCNAIDETNVDDQTFIDMERTMCPEYNTPELLAQRAAELRATAEAAGAQLGLHVRHIAPSNIQGDIVELLLLDSAEEPLRAIAEGGAGDYRAVESLGIDDLR